MYFKIVIEKAKIPDNYSNIYVEYDVKLDNNKKETFKTKIVIVKLFRLNKRLITLSSIIRRLTKYNVSHNK